MGIKATPGQRDILGDIIDLFTPKLAIEIRRYKDLGYESSPIDFINQTSGFRQSRQKINSNNSDATIEAEPEPVKKKKSQSTK